MPNVKRKNKYLLKVMLVLSLIINIFTFSYIYSLTRTPVDINVLERYVLPALLYRYRDNEFKNTITPNKSPFGGELYNFTEVTTEYLDPGYYTKFGYPHYALDIIPTKEYYKKSRAYNIAKRPVVFATHNGTVRYLVDESGANYIVVTNISDNVRTMYVHLEASYVDTGQSVVAGQPIGIMGNTGFTTGTHLHYAVQTKNRNGVWVNVDPKAYIVE